jgi:hypothetical protein
MTEWAFSSWMLPVQMADVALQAQPARLSNQ